MKIVALTVAVLLWLTVNASSTFAQEHTSCDNVTLTLKHLVLEDAVVLVECHESYVIAKPTIRPDGSVDDRLWQYIEKAVADHKGWIHDNTVASRLMGHGKFSYRQTSRPSMQAVFHFKDGVLSWIKLDHDRFPPGWQSAVSSFRHLAQEQLKNLLFRKCTDQDRMWRSLQKRYIDDNKSSSITPAVNTP